MISVSVKAKSVAFNVVRVKRVMSCSSIPMPQSGAQQLDFEELPKMRVPNNPHNSRRNRNTMVVGMILATLTPATSNMVKDINKIKTMVNSSRMAREMFKVMPILDILEINKIRTTNKDTKTRSSSMVVVVTIAMAMVMRRATSKMGTATVAMVRPPTGMRRPKGTTRISTNRQELISKPNKEAGANNSKEAGISNKVDTTNSREVGTNNSKVVGINNREEMTNNKVVGTRVAPSNQNKVGISSKEVAGINKVATVNNKALMSSNKVD